MGPLFNDPQAQRLTQLMDVASLRARVHAANIANQNTPGYKAQAVAFEDAFREALGDGGDTSAVAPSVFERTDLAVQPDGNNVSSEREVLEMGQNQTLYNAWAAMAQGKKKLLNIAITAAP